MPKEQYRRLLHHNITQNYKIASDTMFNEINNEARGLAAKIEFDNRMEALAKADTTRFWP